MKGKCLNCGAIFYGVSAIDPHKRKCIKCGGRIIIPVQVSMPAGVMVTAIAAGHDFGLPSISYGAVLAWGYNGNGKLGNGNNANNNILVSVKIPVGITVTAIAAGCR